MISIDEEIFFKKILGNIYLDMDGRKMLNTTFLTQKTWNLRPEPKMLLFLRLEPKPHFLGPCIITVIFIKFKNAINNRYIPIC